MFFFFDVNWLAIYAQNARHVTPTFESYAFSTRCQGVGDHIAGKGGGMKMGHYLSYETSKDIRIISQH